MVLMDVREIRKEQGFCWIADLPAQVASGGDNNSPFSSVLLLFEDDQELRPGRALHAVIRELGRGAYSHWERNLYFSTSDNSDPRVNGRIYRVVAPVQGERLRDHRDFSGVGGQPANLRSIRRNAEQIAQDAAYALGTADSYVSQLPEGRQYLHGRSVLEIGPGENFGAALILRCWGARRVAVTDRFLATFDGGYNGMLYEEIARALKAADPDADVSPLLNCAEAREHPQEVVTSMDVPLEEIAAHSREPFDVTLSNAVFEHLSDPLAAFQALHEVSAPRGVGYHQVDFRDHRDFSRPLEFLLLNELTFARMFHERHGECGNRMRPGQMAMMLKCAGFDTVHFAGNMEADASYLADLVVRMKSSPFSPFSETNPESLRQISGRFTIARL